MSKITTILDLFVSRLAAVSNVPPALKRQRVFTKVECPGITVYRSETARVEDDYPVGKIAQFDMTVTVDYFREQYREEDPSERAETMIEEILAVVEVVTDDLCDVLSQPIYLISDDVLLPEEAGDVIRVQTIFQCRFIREYGG